MNPFISFLANLKAVFLYSAQSRATKAGSVKGFVQYAIGLLMYDASTVSLLIIRWDMELVNWLVSGS